MAAHISRIIPLLIITLLSIVAVEGGYRVFEYLLFREPSRETVAPGSSGPEEPPAAAARLDPAIILARNLFGDPSEGEIPPAPAVDMTVDLQKSELEVVLVGTIGGSEGTHRAIILDKKTRKQDLYRQGDEVQGANVKEIMRGRVVLEVEGREELLDMSEAATVRPAAQGAQGQAMRLGRQDLMPPEPVPPAQALEPQAGPVTVSVGSQQLEPQADEAVAGEEAAPVVFPEEAAPGAVPEGADPQAALEASPEASPEVAPPVDERQASERRIVRPRVIRPYRQ